jgi:7-cyano-7-deazaguanine synthase
VFSKLGFNKQSLSRIVGSWALAAFEKTSSPVLHLATNYQPLWLTYYIGLRAVFFASLPEYMDPDWDSLFGSLTAGRIGRVVPVKPYTRIALTCFGSHEEESLRTTPRQKKVLVVASGGLDSSTLATMYVQQGHEVELLHFTYGCRAEAREVQSIKAVAQALGVKCRFVPLGELFTVLAPSRLTNTKATFATGHGGEEGAEFAHEWVPARNLVMMAIATAIAEGNGFDTIALGANLEESGAYSDNTTLWRRRLADVVEVSTNVNCHVTVEAPFDNLMKSEIVRKAIEIGAPVEHMWSCYEGRDISCGTCGPCQMRRVGFKMSGIIDPIPYEWLPENFWEGCKPWVSRH